MNLPQRIKAPLAGPLKAGEEPSPQIAEKTARGVIILAMRILLTGVSGFAGSALLPRLLDEGHDVRAFAREEERVRHALSQTDGPGLSDFQLVVGDALSDASLKRAMRGVEVAYYLIHSMEPQQTPSQPAVAPSSRAPVAARTPGDGHFVARERIAAEAFARTARTAGVGRIVYLGGLLPRERAPSQHLSSRHTVERILLEAIPDSVALRASLVIGARSRSFRVLVRLIERMPLLILPAWRRFRTQPIDGRDVVEMLAAAAGTPSVAGRTLDIGGPDVLSYEQIIERIAALMLLGRPIVGLGLTVTPIAARLAAVLAGESPELVVPLMEGLTADLLPAGHNGAEIFGVSLHSFDSAVEHALGEWEKIEPLAAR